MIMFLVNRREFRKMMYFEDAWLDGECALMQNKIYSLDDVSKASEKVYDFCNEHGRGKMALKLSLAVEEMATNTVVEGFRPGKHNSIDMRILKKGDDYIVRIRDDCLIFNPVKQLQLYSDKVPMHHIGLRMAIGSAKDVQYTCVLKLNNLVIRV